MSRGVWRSADHIPSMANTSVKDDFFVGSNTSSTIGELRWTLTNGSATAQAAEVNHPGIMRIATSAVINTFVSLRLSGGSTALVDPDDFFDLYWLVRVNTVDANTTVRLGLGNNSAGNPPTDGIYIEKLAADTSWFGVTRAASSETRTAALATVTAGWVKLRMRRVSATQIGFTVDNAAEVLATATITGVASCALAQITNTAAADKTVDLDYFALAISGLTR
jgi:hypothetical protein